MLSYITIPIRIFLSALLLGNSGSNATIIPSSIDLQTASAKNITISISTQFEIETGTIYEAVLRDSFTSKELGRIGFSYNKFTQTGYISRLHVAREERKQSYGSILLKFALEKLTQLNCLGIYWQAYPFDLNVGQTSENMLPKLIAFYQRHGAQVLSQNTNSAQMAYYPQITTPQAA